MHRRVWRLGFSGFDLMLVRLSEGYFHGVFFSLFGWVQFSFGRRLIQRLRKGTLNRTNLSFQLLVIAPRLLPLIDKSSELRDDPRAGQTDLTNTRISFHR